MSLLKYNLAKTQRDLRYPTIKGQLGINPPQPGADSVLVSQQRRNSALKTRVVQQRELSAIRNRRAGQGLGRLGFDWGSLIKPSVERGFDIATQVIGSRPGSFQTTQTIDPRTGQVLTSTSGRQPTNFALPVNISQASAGFGADVGAGVGGGLIIVGGAALLLVLVMSRGRGR